MRFFGDGIMSAIDMSVDIQKVEDPVGVPRMVVTLEWQMVCSTRNFKTGLPDVSRAASFPRRREPN